MPKKKQRWPNWKIVTTMAACAVTSAVLFWLWIFLQGRTSVEGDPNARRALAAPGFLLLLATAAAFMAVCAAAWLGYRIYKSRIPPWERGAKKLDRRLRRR